MNPNNRLKPFLDSLNAFTEAKRECVGTVIKFFDFMKAEHQKEIRKPHMERLCNLIDEAVDEREDEIKEALRTGDEETFKRIRGEIIRLVLDQEP